MNVAHQFEQIRILPAQDGFIAVLEDVPRSVMTAVEVNRVACRKATHDGGNRHATGSNEQMEMVGNECPSKTARGGLGEKSSEAFDKMVPVGVVEEDLSPLDSTAYDVVQCTRRINASLSCHEKKP